MDHESFLSSLNDNLITKSLDELKNEQFSSEVSSGRVKFLTVVESLEGVLTNENINTRKKGVEFLSWLLSQLPRDLFNSSEISVVVNFFCDCLKGHHSIMSSAIGGVYSLIQMKQISKDDKVKILVILFQNVNCQSQLQPERLVLYSVLKYVIENCLEDFKQMGLDFVFGIISFIEGEADPFCLILIFNFLPTFIKNFDLGHFSEEMFEMLSCYFPVDFNPAPKENSVTREDLSDALHQCLSATDSFSEQSIPLILEKVESSLQTAKLDCYKLLKECCKNIRVKNIEEHLVSIRKSMTQDVLLPGNDKQVCDAGLSALSEVVHLLSVHESHQHILTTFVDDIIITVRSLTNRIDENMFQPAIRVLVAAASKSKPATQRILHHLKSFCQLGSNSSLMERKIILSALLPFLKICLDFKISDSKNTEEVSCYKELVAMYLNEAASIDYETQKLAFLGILEILPVSNQEFRKKLYEVLMENIRTKEDVKLSNEFFKVWRCLGQNHESEFFSFLSEDVLVKETDDHFSNYLWALSFISDFPKFTSYVIPFLINVIKGRQKHVTALSSLLNACKLVRAHDLNNFFHLIHTEHNIIDSLIYWYLDFKPKEELILNLVSEIIALVTRNQNLQSQEIIVNNIIQLFFGEVPTLNGSGNCISNIKNFSEDFVLILEAVVGSVRLEIKIPMVWLLSEKLINFALSAPDECVRLSSSRLLATLVNKSEESFALELLDRISKDILEHLKDDRDLKVKLNASFLFTWIVKGIVLRGGPTSEKWISNWFALLGRKDVGEAIAEGFQTVIEEDDLYLNLESYCNVRVLYRQRLFVCHSKLVKMYETSDESVKINYLLALVRLFQGVPFHLIQMEICNVITVLVRCLDTDKPEVLLTSLEILKTFLETKEKIFSDYIQSFVPKFLKLTRFEKYMKIRINALKCLYFYGFYPTTILLPLKNEVIRELEFCLDDKKRLVRKEAVRARCRWFLVGAPGEDILDL